jgi:hypothetical protein
MRNANQTLEQRCADVVAAQEFHQIQKFVAACRRQWPGAIMLRPEFWADARRAQGGRIRPPDEPGELQNFVRRHHRQRRASHLGRQNREKINV